MALEDTQQTIGKYQILGVLGRGPTGMIYKARDPEIERIVSVKTWKKPYGISSEAAQRVIDKLIEEARALGGLKHPNILHLFEVKREGDSAYMVTDYVEGEMLDAMLSSHRRLPIGPTSALLEQLSSAIDYAHSKRVVHGDIRPGNILIGRDGQAYLMDFGLSVLKGEAGDTGNFLGTPAYASPELLSGEKASEASDLFSFAVVLFECLTGMRPFAGEDVATLLRNVTTAEPKVASVINPELPEGINDVFNQALSKVPKDRFRNARDIQRAVERQLRIVMAKEAEAEVAEVGKEERLLEAVDTVASLTEKIAEQRNKPESKIAAKVSETFGKVLEKANDATRGVSFGGREKKAVDEDALIEAAHRVGDSQRGLPDEDEDEQKKEKRVKFKPPRSGFGGGGDEDQDSTDKKGGIGGYNSTKSAGKSKPDLVDDEPVIPKKEPVKEKKKIDPKALRRIKLGFVAVLALAIVGGGGYWGVKSLWPMIISLKGKIIPKHQATVSELINMPLTQLSDGELIALIKSGQISETKTLETLHEAQRREVKELLDPCLYLLGSSSYLVRIEALRILGELRKPAVLPRILSQLEDKDPLVRLQVVRTIMAYDDSKALSALLYKKKGETTPEVRAAIQAAIERLSAESSGNIYNPSPTSTSVGAKE